MRLDALGNRGHLEFPGHAHDVPDDDLGLLIVFRRTEEHAVELEHAHGQRLEHIERRIPRPKIVYGALYPRPAQFMHGGTQQRHIVEKDALGELQFQQAVGDGVQGLYPDVPFDEIRRVELHPRHVDRQGAGLDPGVEPLAQQAAYGCEHELIELDDKAVLFKKRNEFTGRKESLIRALPAHQRLPAREGPGPDPIFRLDVDEEFPIGKSLFHAYFQILFPQQFITHGVIVKFPLGRALHLDRLQGHVGAIQQRIDVRGVAVFHAADAGTQLQLVILLP